MPSREESEKFDEREIEHLWQYDSQQQSRIEEQPESQQPNQLPSNEDSKQFNEQDLAHLWQYESQQPSQEGNQNPTPDEHGQPANLSTQEQERLPSRSGS